MTDNSSGAPPVAISDSASRVALDLALRITQDSRLRPEQRDEKYWLTLYSKCHRATHGEG